MSKTTDQLDAEIAELEAAQYGKPKAPDGEQGESVVADQSSSETEVTPEAQASTTIESQVTPESTAEHKSQKKERVNWKKRYVNLKQHHDTSRQQDRKKISELLNENTALHRELIARKAEIQKLTMEKPQSVSDLATKEELEVLGEEGVSSIDKLTRKAIEDATGPLKAEINELRQQRLDAQQAEADRLAQQGQNYFLEQLGELVPDYIEIDEDPAFGEFLKKPDPASGRLRLDLFKQAELNGDVGRVAYFFKQYSKSKGPSGKQQLAQKVAPVGSQGSPHEAARANGGEGQPEFLAMSDYRTFMDDLTKGKYAGKQQLANEIEAKFDLAIAEGRLR